MAENRRGKENRYYFTRGQMILLGAAFTSAAVVIFFLGMFVGKGVEERKILKEGRAACEDPGETGRRTGRRRRAKERRDYLQRSGGEIVRAECWRRRKRRKNQPKKSPQRKRRRPRQ